MVLGEEEWDAIDDLALDLQISRSAVVERIVSEVASSGRLVVAGGERRQNTVHLSPEMTHYLERVRAAARAPRSVGQIVRGAVRAFLGAAALSGRVSLGNPQLLPEVVAARRARLERRRATRRSGG